MMRHILFFLLFSAFTLTSYAGDETGRQQHRKFDPERFQVEMEQHITQKAGLTPQEASVFFPLFREMLAKQRMLFDQTMRRRMVKPADEAGCRKFILERDEQEIQMKELQLEYHKKFLNVISASKLYDIQKAEDEFHRMAFRRSARWQGGHRGNRGNRGNK